jgi:hypothetical protein
MSPDLDKRSLTLLACALSFALLLLVVPLTALAQEPRKANAAPVYLVYYWRARPGKAAEYADYIRKVAEPIDEEARKAGVFEELRTYTPAFLTGAPGADWTHMRVFRLNAFAALDSFSAGMDAATRRVFPDDSKRPRADELRDLVRQEVWRDFR